MRTSERDMVLRALGELEARFANNPKHHERELYRLEEEVKAGSWPPRRRRRPAEREPEAVGDDEDTTSWPLGADPEPGERAEPDERSPGPLTEPQGRHLRELLAAGPLGFWRPRNGGEMLAAKALHRKGLVASKHVEGLGGLWVLTEPGRRLARRMAEEVSDGRPG